MTREITVDGETWKVTGNVRLNSSRSVYHFYLKAKKKRTGLSKLNPLTRETVRYKDNLKTSSTEKLMRSIENGMTHLKENIRKRNGEKKMQQVIDEEL